MRLSRFSTRFFGMAALLTLMACRRDIPARGNDTARPSSPPPIADSAAPVAPLAWDTTAGPMIVVPAGSGTTAHLVFPRYTNEYSLDSVNFDLEAPRSLEIELQADGRPAGTARIAAVSLDRAGDCTTWPTARLQREAGARDSSTWSAGFVRGRVEPIPYDSIQGLTRQDSTRLAIELARLASALPGDTASAFRGRPFVVRQARRYSIAGRIGVLAEIIRAVNQEATPLQEHLLVIAERDSAGSSAFSTAYFERSIGLEDAVETTDLLAVVRPLGRQSILLLLSRDFGDGGTYAVLERMPSGRWKLRWTSAYAGC